MTRIIPLKLRQVKIGQMKMGLRESRRKKRCWRRLKKTSAVKMKKPNKSESGRLMRLRGSDSKKKKRRESELQRKQLKKRVKINWKNSG